MNPDTKTPVDIDKLLSLLSGWTREHPSKEDVVKMFEAITSTLKENKQGTDAEFRQIAQEMGKSFVQLKADAQKGLKDSITRLDNLEEVFSNLQQGLSEIDNKASTALAGALKRLSAEIKEVKALIPTLPDLTPLGVRIDGVEYEVAKGEKKEKG